MIQRYIGKISDPLLDRIHIHIDVPAVNYKELRAGNEPESSAKIRERVMRAREIQLQRSSSSRSRLYCNAPMAPAIFVLRAISRPTANACWSAP